MGQERTPLEELLYGNIPDFDLPGQLAGMSAEQLRAASTALGCYATLAQQFNVDMHGDPIHVLNQLRTVIDEAAISKASNQGDRK